MSVRTSGDEAFDINVSGTDKRLHLCSQEASMSCTVLVLAKNGASKPMVAHTFDTAGGTDFRLVKVVRERARSPAIL